MEGKSSEGESEHGNNNDDCYDMESTSNVPARSLSVNVSRVQTQAVINPYMRRNHCRGTRTNAKGNTVAHHTNPHAETHDNTGIHGDLEQESENHVIGGIKAHAPPAIPHPQAKVTASPVENQVVPHHQQRDQSVSVSASVSAETRSLEERLPSRNVSFQSGECLSVRELHTFAKFYQDRSVRVTGVILHRYVEESDHSICVVLGDVLAGERPISRCIAEAQTPRKQPLVTTAPPIRTQPVQTRPEIKTPTSTTTTMTPSDRLALYRKRTIDSGSFSGKRRLVHVPKTPGSKTLLSGNKRRLSFTTPIESAIRSLISKQTFLAIVNPLCHPHVADCGVGDNIMLIGEIVCHNVQSSRAEPFLSLYRNRLERKHNNTDHDNNDGVDDDTHDAKPVAIFYLEPRILRNVNTTNLRLQHEALLQRRAHVRQLNDNPVQPGRGPPPHVDPTS